MSKIKVMDEILANKIAAGEVVERIVSIVKELVENSIDAKSDEIKIELVESGLREIKITDNGIGMDEETLKREIMEEACTTLKDVNYLGAVEVVENGETYYQLRYTAHANEVLPFTEEWETSEREFVALDNLPDYIKWAKGVTFSAQIDSARKFWNI